MITHTQTDPVSDGTTLTDRAPVHEKKTFHDPEEKQHGWAAELRPQFRRSTLPDIALSERLIEAVGDHQVLLKLQDKPNQCCIVGSLVLQRILSQRYLGLDDKLDRDLYPIEDVDVWFTSEEALQEFSKRLHEGFAGDHILKLTDIHSYRSGLYIHPLRLYGNHDDPSDNSRFRAKIDLSSPETVGSSEAPDPDHPGHNKLTIFGQTRKIFAHTVESSQRLPMANIDGKTEPAPALTDESYLELLETTLMMEKSFPSTVTKHSENKLTSQDKIRQNILPLLLYMEATRKMVNPWWQPDAFSEQLLRLCHAHIPEQTHTLIELLRKKAPGNAKKLQRILGLSEPETQTEAAHKTILQSPSQKTNAPVNVSLTEEKYQEPAQMPKAPIPPASRLEEPQNHDIQQSSVTPDQTRSASPSPELVSDTKHSPAPIKKKKSSPSKLSEPPTRPDQEKDAAKVRTNHTPKVSRRIQALEKALEQRPSPLTSPLTVPPDIQTKILLAPDEELDACLQGTGLSELQKRTKHPDRCLTNILSLRKAMRQLSREVYHPDYSGEIHSNLCQLTNDKKSLSQALVVIQAIDHRLCPYAGYLEAMILQQLNHLNHVETPQQNIDYLLYQAARSGIPAAAMALLKNALGEPASQFPASAAARLVMSSASQPDSYKLHILRADPYPVFSDGMSQTLKMLERGLTGVSQENGCLVLGESLQQLASTLPEQEARERTLMLASTAFALSGQHNRIKNCQKKAQIESTTGLSNKKLFDWLILSFMDESSKAPFDDRFAQRLTVMPESQLCTALIRGDEKAFTSATAKLDANQSCHWFDWLPLCIPIKKLSQTTTSEALKKFWPNHNVHQTPSTGIAKLPRQEIWPTHAPQEASQIHIAFGAENSDAVLHLIADTRNMDYLLSQRLLKNTIAGEHHDSVVWQGIVKTSDALQLLGAKAVDDSVFIDLDFSCTQETQRAALALLEDAMNNHGNPYAALLYARLNRAVLVQNRATPEGEQNWYNHYLIPLYFSAVQGCLSATDDLFLELLNGHADALLVPIMDVFCNRYKSPQIHQLQFQMTWDHPGHLEQNIRTYHVLAALNAQSPHEAWQEFLSGQLPQISAKKANNNPLSKVRHGWVGATLYAFLEEKDDINLSFSIGSEDRLLDIPLGFQFSMMASLACLPQHIQKKVKKQTLDILHPEVKSLMTPPSDEVLEGSGEAPLSHEACRKILPYVLWQLPGSGLREWIPVLKKRAAGRKQTRPVGHGGEQLVTLYHYTRQLEQQGSDVRTTDIPHPEIHPWVETYQLLKPDAHIRLKTLSPELSEHAQKLKQMEETLVSQLQAPSESSLPLVQILAPVCLQPVNDHSPVILNFTSIQEIENCLARLEKNKEAQLPYDPYIPLMKGLCLMAKQKESISQSVIVQTATHMLESALWGSQDAARYFARLAMCYHNSPMSLERVLEVFLMQRQRARQHAVLFTSPISIPEDREKGQILEVLDRLCLNKEWGNQPDIPQEEFLKKQLIPELSALLPQIRNHETRAQLSLLISHAYKLMGVDGRYKLFKDLQLSSLSTSTLLQWSKHIKRAPGNDIAIQIWCEEQQENLGNCLLKRTEPNLIVTPNIVKFPSFATALSGHFWEWHHQDGSWLQLPVFMSSNGLQSWLRTHPKSYCYLDKTTGRTSVALLPGIRASEKYQCLVNEKFMHCLRTGDEFRVPYPNSEPQMTIGRHGHNAHEMERVHIAPPPPKSQHEAAINPTSHPKTKAKAKKKSRHKSTSRDDIG